MVRFERVDRRGWSTNMFCLPLRDDRLLIYSPTWLGEDTFDKIEALGRPGVLLAPNYFHHLSLARFRERYPDAIAVAGEAALPRLRARGHRGLQEIAAAEALLPEGTRFLRCAGIKAGEVWMSFIDEGRRTLLVCDAFFHVRRPVTGIAGFLLRRLGIVPGLKIGDTFRWFAVADRAVYRAWVAETLRREAPTRLAVSHGDSLEAEDLAEQLLALVDTRLGATARRTKALVPATTDEKEKA
jgi:hypothetical protein